MTSSLAFLDVNQVTRGNEYFQALRAIETWVNSQQIVSKTLPPRYEIRHVDCGYLNTSVKEIY